MFFIHTFQYTHAVYSLKGDQDHLIEEEITVIKGNKFRTLTTDLLAQGDHLI